MNIESAMNAQPAIACTLTPDQLQCQADVLLPGLAARSESCIWSDAGVQLRFAPTTEHLTAIVTAIDRERHCCAFLTFRLTVPASEGSLILELTGPPGTREFLSGLNLDSGAPR